MESDYLTTVEIALIAYAHMSWLGLTHPMSKASTINMPNVLDAASATALLANAHVSTDMKEKVARDHHAPTIALATALGE